MGYWKTKMGNENMKSEIKQEILEKLKLGSFRNFGFIEREYPTYYNYLMTTYNFSKNVSEAFYNDLYHPKLSCDHGNRYNFKSFGRGYGFCGSIKNCLCQREQMSENTKDIFKNISDENLQSMIEKRKKTNLEKYGVEHFTKTGEYKEKTKKTNLEKYGVEHFTQTEEYKEKTKHTNLEKFGVENPMLLDEYKELSAEKRNKTMLEKYGTTHAYDIEEFRTKAAESKIKTNQERYGVDYYYQSDEFKEKRRSSSLKKYGVDHPSKKHYDANYFDIFDNKKKFEKKLYDHGTYKLADMVNCDVSSIHLHASKNNIILPPRPRSYQEETIIDFLVQNNISFMTNHKKILPSGKELDFYLPEHNLAIEINGIYWHTELSGGKDRNYHYNKWKECDALGITLLSIQEDEFAEKTNFWLNKILYMTRKLSLTKIHARKCEIRELNNVSEFLETHHIQGFCSSSYKLGLFYDDNLVSVMTFSKPRDNKNKTIDLSRFCNHSDYLVSGGASKLLSYFVKTYGHSYENIISFSDNNYSNGNVYGSLGFDLAKELAPDYKYTKQGKRYHKAAFRKDAIFSKFDIPEDMKNATEWELMQYLGYDRIWDTGKKKWEMKI
jgi:very-short-patch-repair endonuclease